MPVSTRLCPWSPSIFQNRYQMFDFRRIDILRKSNTRSKIFRTSIKAWQLYSCCRYNSAQTKKWVSLPVLVKSKTRNGIFLSQFGPHITHDITRSTREYVWVVVGTIISSYGIMSVVTESLYAKRKWFIVTLWSCIEYYWKMRFVLRFL